MSSVLLSLETVPRDCAEERAAAPCGDVL